MMNKQQSPKINSLKMLSILPILAILLTAFNKAETLKVPKGSMKSAIEQVVASAKVELPLKPKAFILKEDSTKKKGLITIQKKDSSGVKMEIVGVKGDFSIMDLKDPNGNQPLFIVDGVPREMDRI